MELDDLLADLQSSLPPEAKPQSPVVQPSPASENGTAEYEMPVKSPANSSSKDSTGSAEFPFDDAKYSEVKKKESVSSPPPSKPPRSAVSSGASEGLSELDNLLAMLSDTQKHIQSGQEKKVTSGRKMVAEFVDELTEVENQVSNKSGQQASPESSTAAAAAAATATSPTITASSATQELDELMANLEKFEPSSMQEQKTPVSKPVVSGQQKQKTAFDNLNSMLGCLEQDMTQRHGVSTASKGECAACNKPIVGKVVNAIGKQWHPKHFVCTTCGCELGSVTYYESGGQPYCEKDFNELFAPRCAYCNGPILDRVMRALDKTWHPDHFFCTSCGNHFGPDGFHEKDEKAYCRECYYEKFAPHCRRCDKAIMEGYITALNAQWHPECFSCKICEVTFPRGNYFDHEGEPHCEIHYHAARGTLCASCQKPVVGKCVTAMGKKFHPEHFTCAFCLKLLNKGTFKEHRNNPYCQACYIKLFG